MNNKAQFEISPMGIIFGIVGGLIAVVISARMVPGLFMKVLAFITSGIACYIIGWRMSNS